MKYNEVLKRGMNLLVADSFYFRGVRYFYDTIKIYKDSVQFCDGNIISASTEYDCEYFTYYQDTSVTRMIEEFRLNASADFWFGMSFPRENYMVCEIWHTIFGDEYYTKFGEALRILSIFDDKTPL